MTAVHLDRDTLTASVDQVRRSPADAGVIELIVRRPAHGERELLDVCELDVDEGLVGDNWRIRGSRQTPDGSAHPLGQITLMNARFAALIAGDPDRRPLAGDQFYVDLDLSGANLPPGTRVALGTAVLEITDKPHTGCKKFWARFGSDAWRFVNSPVGKELRLRGINARVVESGTVQVGDTVRKL